MNHIFIALLIGVVAGAISETWAAPLTFNTALPVGKNEFIIREQLVINKSSDDPSGMGKDRTAWSVVSTLVYGVTPAFTLFATVPYTNRRLKSNINTRSARGIGDSRLLGRYTIYQDDFQGGTFRISPFAGLKLPTGNDSKADSFGTLPTSVQTGSGSWDMFGGFVATYATVNWEVDAQLGYQRNGKARDFKVGDTVRADASLQYRLFPVNLTEDTLSFINGLLEVNLVFQDKHKKRSMNNPHSGGTTLFITPGLQYVTGRYIIEGSVQIPILQNLNGTALKNDYISRIGFRINF